MTQSTIPQTDFCLTIPVFQAVYAQSNGTVLGYLSVVLSNLGETQLQNWASQGRITLNGQPLQKCHSLSSSDNIELNIPNHIEQSVDASWHILWQNDEIMALFKPASLPVSRTTRNLYMTLISLVRRQTPYVKAQLLHRLDTETSGVILVAKNSAADKKWKKKLPILMQRKVYRAWVVGEPAWQQRAIKVLLGQKQNSEIRSQAYVVSEHEHQALKPKESHSHFTVIQRSNGRSLIECEIFTGRKHQIRAHLAYLGHPIIGDKIYSHNGYYYLKRLKQPLTKEDISALGAETHLLQAYQLELLLDDKVSVTVHANQSTANIYY